MNTKDIDNAINHIISLQEKLSTCEEQSPIHQAVASIEILAA